MCARLKWKYLSLAWKRPEKADASNFFFFISLSRVTIIKGKNCLRECQHISHIQNCIQWHNGRDGFSHFNQIKYLFCKVSPTSEQIYVIMNDAIRFGGNGLGNQFLFLRPKLCF